MSILSFDGVINDPKRAFVDAFEEAKAYSRELFRDRRVEAEDFYGMRILREDNGSDAYLKNYFRVWDSKKNEYIYPEFIGLEPVPLVRRIVREKGKIYRSQPLRLVGGEMLNEYNTMLQRSGWNTRSKEVDRLTFLLNDIAVGVFPREDKMRLRFNIQTDYIPLFDPGDLLNPIAIIYPSGLDDKHGNPLYAYYDAEQYLLFDAMGGEQQVEGVTTGEHGLGVFPWVFPHYTTPVDSHFQAPRVELIEANKQVNIAKTALNQLMHYNGHKQLAISGDTAGDITDFIIGKSMALTLTQGNSPNAAPPSVDVIDMQANFEGHINAIKFSMELAAWNADVRIKWSIEGGFQSGVAMRISDIGNIEDRQMTAEVYAEVLEQPMFNIARKYAEGGLLNKFDGGLIKENSDITYKWPHIDYPETVEETARREEHEIKNNISTAIDIIMSKNPTLKLEDAVRQYLWNIRANQQSTPAEEPDELASIFEPTDEEVQELMDEQE
jgi:hypothetical protein